MNKTKKITLIANADSIWTERYIKYVLNELSEEILVITPKIEERKGFYKENNIRVKLSGSRQRGHIGVVISLIKMLMFLCVEKPDIIIVQFVHRYIAWLLCCIPFRTRIIYTYIGSDLLRSSTKKLQSVRKSVRRADEIVVMTKELKEKFLSIYGLEMLNKVSIIDMGDTAFSEIDLIRDKKYEQKVSLIGEAFANRVIITIGYNANEAQQQDKILIELDHLSQEYKDKIYIVLPMTYQCYNDEYINYVGKIARKSEIPCLILREFMNDAEIATLCVATDIFINAQTTDALSNSMLEQLYAGSLVLNAEWLMYNFLEEQKIYYGTFASTNCIAEEIKKYLSENKLTPPNDRFLMLKEQCSWSNCLEKWRALIN